MKKIICLLIPLILLCSCGKKSEVKPNLSGISFKGEIVYYNENYSCECSVSQEGVLTAKIIEPEILSGFVLTVSKDKITADYLGISYTPTTNNMPFSGAIDSFYKALQECSTEDKRATVSGDEYILKGETEDLGYTLYLSPTGLPQKLLLPDERFSVNFYNVTIEN